MSNSGSEKSDHNGASGMCLISSSHQRANRLPVVTRLPKPPLGLPKKLGKSKKVSREKIFAVQKTIRSHLFLNLLKSISHSLNRRPSSAQLGARRSGRRGGVPAILVCHVAQWRMWL